MVGHWITADGTAAVVVGDALEFRPDGTGVHESWSALFGVEREEFRWRVGGPDRLLLRFLDEPEWTVVATEWRTIRTDVGQQEVLGEQGRTGFWVLHAPIAHAGV
jgi:hypothetical protein